MSLIVKIVKSIIKKLTAFDLSDNLQLSVFTGNITIALVNKPANIQEYILV